MRHLSDDIIQDISGDRVHGEPNLEIYRNPRPIGNTLIAVAVVVAVAILIILVV